MSITDELLANNEAYAASFDKAGLPVPPGKKLAVIACMDARLNLYAILGLREGDAHIIRNHHTGCGMLTFTEDAFKDTIQEETGVRPPWAAEAFTDLDADVRQSIARLEKNPFVPHTGLIRGFVFDVATGHL